MSATHGRSEGALTPSGGGAQRLGVHKMSATHGRSEGALTPSGGGAQRLGVHKA